MYINRFIYPFCTEYKKRVTKLWQENKEKIEEIDSLEKAKIIPNLLSTDSHDILPIELVSNKQVNIAPVEFISNKDKQLKGTDDVESSYND